LADVLGPFDETFRAWKLYLWTQNTQVYPLQMDKRGLTQRLSFVYSKDVAKVIL
jgi:hypothetical protein